MTVYSNQSQMCGLKVRKTINVAARRLEFARHKLFFGQEENDPHRVHDDKDGDDVELEQRIVLLDVRLLPRLVPEPQKHRIDLFRMQPLTGK